MSISLCMIVKNEEKYLEGCLNSVEGLVDEIILIDTGSTDKTKSIAEKYNCKIYDFRWIDDFSAARNFSLNKATGDWILYLDADERITIESKKIIRELSNIRAKKAFRCKVISEQSETQGSMEYPRFFRQDENLRFTGSVHEQIEPSLRENNYEICPSDIEIIHLGYNIAKEGLKEKAQRNLRLLLNDYKKKQTGLLAFHIGQSLVELNRLAESIEYFLFAVTDFSFDSFQRAHAYRYVAAYYHSLKDYEKTEYYLQKGLTLNEYQPLLNIIAAEYYSEIGNIEKTAFHIKKAFVSAEYITSNGNKYFEIIPLMENIVMKGIQLAVFICNQGLFNYFYNQADKYVNSLEFKNYLNFFNGLFNKEDDLVIVTKDKLTNYFKPDWVIRIVENHPSNISLLKLEELVRIYSETLFFSKLLIKKYLENNQIEKALQLFENTLSIGCDPELLLLSLNIYPGLERYDELKKVLEENKNCLNNHPELKQKIEQIILKIS